jgi:AraC family transcriptional regulator
MLNYENKHDTNPHREAVQKVMEHVAANVANNITVGEMAEVAGLCERRFRQVFLEITGMQPKKHLDSLRLRMAEELLKNTPFSIGDISERLGYSSQFHFCRAFGKTHGISPSHFRKKPL